MQATCQALAHLFAAFPLEINSPEGPASAFAAPPFSKSTHNPSLRLRTRCTGTPKGCAKPKTGTSKRLLFHCLTENMGLGPQFLSELCLLTAFMLLAASTLPPLQGKLSRYARQHEGSRSLYMLLRPSRPCPCGDPGQRGSYRCWLLCSGRGGTVSNVIKCQALFLVSHILFYVGVS
jgi:hypothetical protein